MKTLKNIPWRAMSALPLTINNPEQLRLWLPFTLAVVYACLLAGCGKESKPPSHSNSQPTAKSVHGLADSRNESKAPSGAGPISAESAERMRLTADFSQKVQGITKRARARSQSGASAFQDVLVAKELKECSDEYQKQLQALVQRINAEKQREMAASARKPANLSSAPTGGLPPGELKAEPRVIPVVPAAAAIAATPPEAPQIRSDGRPFEQFGRPVRSPMPAWQTPAATRNGGWNDPRQRDIDAAVEETRRLAAERDADAAAAFGAGADRAFDHFR